MTKLLVAMAVLVAVEEGTISLDEPAGPPGSTVRHLLAHASGLGPDSLVPVAGPGADAHLLQHRLRGAGGHRWPEHAAHGLHRLSRHAASSLLSICPVPPSPREARRHRGHTGPLHDLLTLAVELLAPSIVSPATLAEATSVAFPGLRGVLPGYGRFDPCDWGLGFEVKGDKDPHWTGTRTSPATFGHFGRAGGFLWVDPVAGLACATLSNRDFGPWAVTEWSTLADAVVQEWASTDAEEPAADEGHARRAGSGPRPPHADVTEQREAKGPRAKPAAADSRPPNSVQVDAQQRERQRDEADRQRTTEASHARTAEAERRAREAAEAERRAHEEAERRAHEEAERRANEEAEAERRANEEAEAERRANEEAEAERRASEAVEAEAERRARQAAEAERRARQAAEAERQASEAAEAEAEAERGPGRRPKRGAAPDRPRRRSAEPEKRQTLSAAPERWPRPNRPWRSSATGKPWRLSGERR